MSNINWLDLFILVFSSLSINYLILKELSVYFLKKPYLSKWVLCIIISTLILVLKIHVHQSFFYLLVLALAGAVELIISIINGNRIKVSDFNRKEYEETRSIVREIINLDSRNNKTTMDDKTTTKAKHQEEKSQNKNRITKKQNFPKIINSERIYNKQEFLDESKSGNIILSDFIQANLKK